MEYIHPQQLLLRSNHFQRGWASFSLLNMFQEIQKVFPKFLWGKNVFTRLFRLKTRCEIVVVREGNGIPIVNNILQLSWP